METLEILRRKQEEVEKRDEQRRMENRERQEKRTGDGRRESPTSQSRRRCRIQEKAVTAKRKSAAEQASSVQ
jgi:hypothetical protein